MIKKKRAHRAFPYNMVNHAVPTEKLCVPFGLHPVVERVSIFKSHYSTTQAAHRQDDFPNFGTLCSKKRIQTYRDHDKQRSTHIPRKITVCIRQCSLQRACRPQNRIHEAVYCQHKYNTENKQKCIPPICSNTCLTHIRQCSCKPHTTISRRCGRYNIHSTGLSHRFPLPQGLTFLFLLPHGDSIRMQSLCMFLQGSC